MAENVLPAESPQSVGSSGTKRKATDMADDAGSSAAAEGTPANGSGGEEQDGRKMVRMWEPQPVVKIHCQETSEPWAVHKAFLSAESSFFQNILAAQEKVQGKGILVLSEVRVVFDDEGTILLNDVNQEHFGHFISALYVVGPNAGLTLSEDHFESRRRAGRHRIGLVKLAALFGHERIHSEATRLLLAWLEEYKRKLCRDTFVDLDQARRARIIMTWINAWKECDNGPGSGTDHLSEGIRYQIVEAFAETCCNEAVAMLLDMGDDHDFVKRILARLTAIRDASGGKNARGRKGRS